MATLKAIREAILIADACVSTVEAEHECTCGKPNCGGPQLATQDGLVVHDVLLDILERLDVAAEVVDEVVAELAAASGDAS